MSENEERADSLPAVKGESGESPEVFEEEAEIKIEDRSVRTILANIVDFLKRDWGRILLGVLVFAAVSAIVYFSANTTDSISPSIADRYEVGQIADKTIISPKTMKATAAHPVEIEEGEKIIKNGFPITEEMLEKLKKLSDVQVTIDYQKIGNTLFFLLLVCSLWIILFNPVIIGRRVEMKELVLESILFILAFFLASFAYKSLIFQSEFRITVAITSTLCVFLVAILFGQLSSFLFTFVLAFGIFAATNFQVVPFLFTLSTGLSAARIVRKISKRIDIVFASILQSVISIVLIVVLKVIFDDEAKNDYFFILPGVAVNAFFSGIFVLGLITPLENLMNTASVFRLMDLKDTDSKVLQKMQIYASGTFSHSSMVAQLSSAACKEIGANMLLAYVASLYHDIGKIEQSEYFTENQEGEAKHKHDSLSPAVSASIIKSHVKRGVEIGKKLHLPRQVIDIISEHHGNSLIAYFYAKAKEIDPNVSVEDFSYPGHPPVSRESAVVMLADTVEAACRSLDAPTPERIEKFIQTLIEGKINNGQLDNCGLTFNELTLIKKSFVRILVGQYHSRIKYPNQKDPDEKKKETTQGANEIENAKAEESQKHDYAKTENESQNEAQQNGGEIDENSDSADDVVVQEQSGENGEADGQSEIIVEKSSGEEKIVTE